MKCERMKELLSALVDDQLGRREALVVERHLQECRECRKDAKLLALMKSAAKRSGTVSAPGDLKANLLAEAKRRRAAAEPPSLRRAPLPVFGFGFAAAFAAAAALVVFVARGPEETIPVDFMLAAHDEYALTQPLAQPAEMTSVLADRLAGAGGER